MKLNLQYFADQQSSGATQTSSSQTSSSVAQSSSSAASSSSAKTYTQDEVNRIASEAAADNVKSLNASYQAKQSSAVAHQKKLDNMNATELQAELKKEHKQRVNKLIAENKQYKQSAARAEALKATNDELAKANVSNASTIAPLLADIDPKARDTKITAFSKWLHDYTDQVKTNVLKGHSEPQVGATANQIPSHPKDLSKMTPTDIEAMLQKDPGAAKHYINPKQF